VSQPLVASVREIYERAPRVRVGDVDAADEAETYPLTGDTVDLVPLARDALLLELPLAPLCRSDCVGLCPKCGADRSEQPCDCIDQPGHPVWAALDSLRIAVEEELAPPLATGRGEDGEQGEQGEQQADRA
jgi:uncharacterized protein